MPRCKANHEKNRLLGARLKRKSLFPKTFKHPSDPEQAKGWLRGVADHLSNFPNAGPSFRFVAYAIKKYLRAPKSRNLSKELGLVNPVGSPGNFQARMTERKRGRIVVRLRDEGKSWPDIGEAVGLQDKRSVKRLYDKYSPLLQKQCQLDRISAEMKEFFCERKEERP